MNTWFKRNAAALLAIVGISIGLFATLQASALSRKPASPTSVAVVDWIAITDKANEWAEMAAQISKIGDDLRAEDSNMQKALADLKESISVLPAGSESQQREQDKYVIQSLQHEAWTKFAENKLNSEKARRQVRMYNKITTAVAKIADRDGWQIVLWDDSRSKQPDEAKLADAAEVIGRRQVLYSRKDAVDITDEVILLLNNEFNAGP